MVPQAPPPPGQNTSSDGKAKVLANVQSDTKSGLVGEKSLKSQRTYQVGVVYKDIYGRETPVFTSKDGTFTVPKDLSDKRNAIVANLQNQAPAWVDTFKFFVKETSNEYYNACMDRWYDAEDDNLWLSFPSAERNKIKEDGFIILKKQAASQDAVYEEARYKVIDIQNEAPQDIKIDYELYGTDTINIMQNSALPGSKTIKFDFTSTHDWENSVFYDPLLTGASNAGGGVTETGFVGWPLEDVVIKLSNTSGTNTGWLDVANMYKDTDVFVELSKPLLGENDGSGGITVNSAISNIIPDPSNVSGTDVVVKFAKKVVKNKAEFDGKFFVKIARDAVLDQKVREIGNVSANFSVTNQVDQYYFTNSTSNSTQTFWSNVGERWFIDEASRAKTGSGVGTNYKGPFDRDNGFGIKGNGSGKRTGDSQTYLQCTMELTLNKIKDGDKDGYSIGNNKQSNQDFLNKMLQKGTLFRWQEDPFQHVYRIVSCGDSRNENTTEGPPDKSWKRGILNYSSSKSARKDKKNKSIRLYLKFVTTGWRLNLDQASSGIYQFFEDEQGLYPFNFNGQYTPPLATVGTDNWNPTKRGYGEYSTVTGDANYTDSATASTAWTSIGQGVTSPKVGLGTSDDGWEKHNTLQIVRMEVGDKEPTVTKEPAIWETEPREDVGLDIYYEASQAYPTRLTDQTNELFAPYGCTVTSIDVNQDGDSLYLPDGTILWDWAPTGNGGNSFLLNAGIGTIGILYNGDINPTLVDNINTVLSYINGQWVGNNAIHPGLIGQELQFTRPDGSYTTAKISQISAWSAGFHNIDPTVPNYTNSLNFRVKITLDRNLTNSKIRLPYFNCYSFGNGVESDRIRDDFNAVTIGKGVKASTVLPELYKEEQRTNGLIYSGIYNSNSSINNLNQFIGAEKITKDVPPTYGSIQKLKARDTNLVTFCEDKILKIQAYKDALYKADGNPDVISTNKVLGDISSFAGEFGISKNPESYAEDGFRMYCTDQQRGKVLRISGDGITPISSVGMEDYFADNLKDNVTLLGTFDDRKQEYNLTLREKGKTLSFSETAKGWTSFKSFIPESGLSINNNYYTFKDGEIWEHHVNSRRNNFYNVDYNSHVDVLFNEESATVKSFASMKYEGTQGKITQNLTDEEYYNNIGKPGWYVESGITDLQEAGEMEFRSKEGKWFSHMKGKPVDLPSDLNSKEFSFQGIDVLSSIVNNDEGSEGSNLPVYGCTDPTATNYDPLATIDDGSCIMPIYGCMDSAATNYDPLATVDDGSCTYPASTFKITIKDIDDEDNTVFEFQIRDLTSPTSSNGAVRVVYAGTTIEATGLTYVWFNGATTSEITGLNQGFVNCTVTDSGGNTYTVAGDPNHTPGDFVTSNIINGCTSPNATNFNYAANTDDGTCTI